MKPGEKSEDGADQPDAAALIRLTLSTGTSPSSFEVSGIAFGGDTGVAKVCFDQTAERIGRKHGWGRITVNQLPGMEGAPSRQYRGPGPDVARLQSRWRRTTDAAELEPGRICALVVEQSASR